MTLQISHNRRGKKLKTIHTDLRPGYSRELPGWMLDPSCCAGMAEGSPQISIEGLNELATLLASLGKTRKRRAASSPLTAKEGRRAEKKMLRSSAAQSGIQKTDTAIPCAYRKSNASILVMQSTQDRTAQNASCCLGGT